MSMQGTPIAQLPSMITRIAVDPAGRSIACATAAGTVHLFDTTSLTEVWSARHGGRWRGVPLHSISISGRGDVVCTGGEDGTAVLWSVPDGRRAARLTYEHRVPVLSSSISRDGRQLALGYRTGVIVLRDMVDHRETGRLHHDVWANQVEHDSTGARIASAGYDKTVRVWHVSDHSPAWRVSTPGLAGSLSIAPEDDRLVVNGFGSRAAVLSMEDGTELGALQHDADVLFVRFSADGRRIVTESETGVVTMWNGESLDKMAELTFDRTVADPHALPAGAAVAFGYGDELRLFTLSSEEST
ncbi:WD40 repeat domain-containing protein [Cellulomonas wangleii]|uniref:WD40 repeat domain-containing protein n=2 Tax=Cellulomonas wangleii TaxID=2816956 RepID=A0ABX8D4X3_9CELL|nr:WD40 repeat domain-containing protein [Cellulomonas wangleii]QVI61885.1 WD40 repeat domain-containing protein [Cellulomonas wangleii]